MRSHLYNYITSHVLDVAYVVNLNRSK